MAPKLSVITATYNDGIYLAEAISSILNQTFSDFEYIIVDDASNDGVTAKHIEEFSKKDSRITALRNKENSGRAASRNRALDVARGTYVAVMDGDDLSTPDRFEKQIKFLEENPSIGYIGSDTRVINKKTGKFIRNVAMPPTHGRILWHFCFSFPFYHSSTMGHKRLFLEAGKYDPHFIRSQDMDLWARMANLTRFANLPEVLYAYRVGAHRSHKLLKDWSQYAVAVHTNHISNLLGYPVDEKTGLIILRSESDRHSNEVPATYAEVLEAINSLLLIYKNLQRKSLMAPEEETFIQQDLSKRILRILNLYPDFPTDIMEDKLLPAIGAAYWRKKIPGGFWRLPYAIMHPRSSLRHLRNKFRDR